MEVKTICVIGAGAMGNGIAQVAAQAGYDVYMRDIDDKFVERGTEAIKKSLARIVKKGKISEDDAGKIVGRIKGTTDVKEAVSKADLIIEAATENIELKKKIFKELDELAPAHVILASNTSTIPIVIVGSSTNRPDKVVGMHFFNPVPMMKCVEVIKSLTTSDEAVKVAVEVAEKMGKSPVVVKDSPAFVANRLIVPFINEAVFALMEGIADSPEDIDTICKLSFGHPMGPLALADLVGLDVLLAVLEILHSETGDPKFRPAPLLRQMVRAGYLGQKAGRGFYDYGKK